MPPGVTIEVALRRFEPETTESEARWFLAQFNIRTLLYWPMRLDMSYPGAVGDPKTAAGKAATKAAAERLLAVFVACPDRPAPAVGTEATGASGAGHR